MAAFFYLFIAGLIGGLVAGLIGIGGGIVYIFILPDALLALDIPVSDELVIANSLAAIFFASLSANYQLIKDKNFYLKQVLWVGIPAVITSFLTFEYVVRSSFYNIKVFNIVSIILMTYMLIFTLLSARRKESRPLENIKEGKLMLAGSGGGIIAALSGMGGGIIIIPILNSILKADIKKASSVSSGAICISAFTISLTNMTYGPPEEIPNSVGYIVVPIVLVLAGAVLLASPFGVRTARKLPSHVISYIYAGIFVLVIIKKIAEFWYL